MGLAASQARYLTLTSRKSDLEYQSQTINSRRIQLSYKTAEIARAYSEGMNNKVIKMQMAKLDTDGTTTKTWEELTFSSLLNTGDYMIIGTGGQPLDPAPYVANGITTSVHHKVDETNPLTLSNADYEAHIENHPDDAAAFTSTVRTTEDEVDDDGKVTKKGGTVLSYVLKSSVSPDVYEKLSDDIKGKFANEPTDEEHVQWGVNPDYTNGSNAADLQTLLVSGKAQIVSRAFYDFMVKNGYSFDQGLSESSYTYKKLMDMWESNKDDVNPGHNKSVIDWRSDESSTFAQRTYTEDDADVLAAYEQATAEVQAQDKMLEMEEKNIETQHKAIETELENVKKVIQKNIDETFKIFS